MNNSLALFEGLPYLEDQEVISIHNKTGYSPHE